MHRYLILKKGYMSCPYCGGAVEIELDCDPEDVCELNIVQHIDVICPAGCDHVWLAEENWKLRHVAAASGIRNLKWTRDKNKGSILWQKLN